MISRRGLLAGVLAASASRALALPSGQITIIVPFSPGASADGIARILATYISENLGHTTIVENRPGGGGSTALIALSKSNADGLTLGIGATGAITVNPHITGAVSFDPLQQLTPMAKLVEIPLVLVSSPASGLRTIADVVRQAKANPQGLNFGTTGVNSSQHLSIEVLKQISGANLVHVPYRGSAPAVTDVLGGQLPLACVDLTSANEHIKAGTVVAVGVTSSHRYDVAPDIPTFAEQGIKDFDIPAWLGMFGPKGLDPAALTQISATVEKALKDKDVMTRIERLACAPGFAPAAQFAELIKVQSDRMKSLIRTVESSKP